MIQVKSLQFLMSEMKPIREKLKHFFFNYWNTITMLAIVIFVIGFGMRIWG